MAKSKQSSNASAPSQTPAPGTSKASRLSRENSRLVGLSILGTVLSIVASVAPLTPLIVTAPVVRPLLRRSRAGEYTEITGALVRWAVSVFLTVLVSMAFVRDRALSSFPFAAGAASAVESALAGTGQVPAGFLYIVLGMISFAILSAVSLGIAACVLGSIALGTAAATAAVFYAHGTNVLLISVVAVPIWQWAVFASATLLFAPAAIAGGRKLYRVGVVSPDAAWLKRRAVLAVGLLALALLGRWLLSGPYLSLVRHWTVF